ncbi:MAG: iron hydrogenase small subunit [Eggerthellaceae bacterium]
MSFIERLVGESDGITRRQVIKGGIVVGISALFAAALPSWMISAVSRAKEFITGRTDALYSIDEASVIRTSHSNPDIIAIYREYLSPGEVLPSTTELSHRLCHTVYGKDVEAHIKELKEHSLENCVNETNALMTKLDKEV